MSGGKTETDLIAHAIAGDQLALAELLHTYYDRLSARISRKLPAPVRGVMSEEDILQPTFVEVFQRISSFQPKGQRAFYRWLITIAEHRLQDAIKAHRAAKRGGGFVQVRGSARAPDDSRDELLSLLSGGEDTPSQTAARHEAIAAMEVCLASLNDDYRTVIQLRYIDGLSVDEAAQAMSKKPRAVRALSARGLKELRMILGRSSQYFSSR